MVVSQLTFLNMNKHILISNFPESLPTRRISLKAVGFPPCCVIYPFTGRRQRVLILCLGLNVSPGVHVSKAVIPLGSTCVLDYTFALNVVSSSQAIDPLEKELAFELSLATSYLDPINGLFSHLCFCLSHCSNNFLYH